MKKRITSGLRITFLIHFLIAGLVGLQHLLAPRVWTDLAGMEISETVTWRLIGAALLSFAATSWMAYRQQEWAKVRYHIGPDAPSSVTILFDQAKAPLALALAGVLCPSAEVTLLDVSDIGAPAAEEDDILNH